MEFISFGKGCPLLIIPGLGDGLTSIRKSALQLYFYYREYGKKARVIIAGRPEPVPPGSTTESMAFEYASLMDFLKISEYNVLGLSMGGMIGQFLGAKNKDNIRKIVLALTVPYSDIRVRKVISEWIELARVGDFRALAVDTALKTYQPPKAQRYARLVSFLVRFMGPKNLERFLRQARACLHHDGRGVLEEISAPVMVISGERDRITPPDLGEELYKRLHRSQFGLMPRTGHGAYEEKRKEFNRLVLRFFEEND